MDMIVGEIKDIDQEEFERIEYEYKEVESKIVDQSRWSTIHSAVYEKDGQYFEVTWSRGSTEQQDNGYEDMSVKRVERKEKTVYIYE